MRVHNGYHYSKKEAKIIAENAVFFSGRALDLVYPSPKYNWSLWAKTMVEYWDDNDINYQEMVDKEEDIIKYCKTELIDYGKYYILGGDL